MPVVMPMSEGGWKGDKKRAWHSPGILMYHLVCPVAEFLCDCPVAPRDLSFTGRAELDHCRLGRGSLISSRKVEKFLTQFSLILE